MIHILHVSLQELGPSKVRRETDTGSRRTECRVNFAEFKTWLIGFDSKADDVKGMFHYYLVKSIRNSL